MTQTILFKTIHGSRLYGLHHAESDYDYYTVVDKVKNAKARYAKQKITGTQDSMVVDFGTWVGMLQSGVPQACEAAFSKEPEVDLIADFRSQLYLGSGAHERYLRTITSFTMTQDPKRKRHGLRLAFNLADLGRYGRFDPCLTDAQVLWSTEQAKKDCDNVYAKAMSIALDNYNPI